MAKTKKTNSKKTTAKKTMPEAKEKKMSALDAAARVLGETGTAMTCPELIAAMQEKGYWSSPAGKTPAATLYSAIQREIAVKGSESRFQKTAPGRFDARDAKVEPAGESAAPAKRAKKGGKEKKAEKGAKTAKAVTGTDGTTDTECAEGVAGV